MFIISALFLRWKWFLDAFWCGFDMSKIKSLIEQGKDSKSESGSIKKRIMLDRSLQQFLRDKGKVMLQMSKEEIQHYRRTSPKFLVTFGINFMDFEP